MYNNQGGIISLAKYFIINKLFRINRMSNIKNLNVYYWFFRYCLSSLPVVWNITLCHKCFLCIFQLNITYTQSSTIRDILFSCSFKLCVLFSVSLLFSISLYKKISFHSDGLNSVAGPTQFLFFLSICFSFVL